jgi:phosphoglycolate/pyridoxal phosphate phosphatase family enzyme
MALFEGSLLPHLMAPSSPLSRPPPRELHPREASHLLANTDTLVFDCDGVLWRGKEAIDGASDALARLRASGRRLLFVSNNSTVARRDYAEKLASLGFLGVKEDDIINSGFAASVWLRRRFLEGDNEVSDSAGNTARPKVFVCGEQGLVDEVTGAGFAVVSAPSADTPVRELERLEVDPEIVAVVCGLDRKLNYASLTYAHLCLTEIPGCAFLATNMDTTLPVPGNRMLPGGGATMAGLICSAGRQPDDVVGKPSTFMMSECILAPGGAAGEAGLSPARTLMIGDRLNTDVAFGRRCKLATLLVLTGVSSLADLPEASDEETPDYWAQSVVDLASGLN